MHMLPPRRRTYITKRQKLALCKHAAAHPGLQLTHLQAWAFQQFKAFVSLSVISRALSSYDKLKDLDERELNYKRLPHETIRRFDAKLAAWVREKNSEGHFLCGSDIIEKARRLSDEMAVPKLARRKLLTGWLSYFQRRHKFTCKTFYGEAASADLAAVERGRFVLSVLLELFAPQDTYNYDETGFRGNQSTNKSITDEPRPGEKEPKDMITVGVCCNRDGSDKRQCRYVGKSAQPRCFGGKKASELGYSYRNGKRKAWMTTDLVNEYVLEFDADMRAQGRQVLLLMDNAPVHHQVLGLPLTNTTVHFLEKNTTSHTQPLDMGIIANTKVVARRLVTLRRAAAIEANLPALTKVNVLESMEMFEEGWAAVTATTIQNCWKKAVYGSSKDKTPAETLYPALNDLSFATPIGVHGGSDGISVEDVDMLSYFLGCNEPEEFCPDDVDMLNYFLC